MTEPEGNGGKITYTIRELLTEIKETLATIDIKLDTKAEKSIVENLDRRVTTIETARATEITYGNQLLTEFRELQRGVNSNDKSIVALQTSKRDKDAFNILWIPMAINIILTIAVALSRFIH